MESLNSHKSTLDRKLADLQAGKDTVEKRLTEMETMLAEKASQVGSLKDQLDAIRSGKPYTALEGKSSESVELPAIVVRSTNVASQKTNQPTQDAPAFSGRILAVNSENNFVVVDVGASAGVKPGDTFSVYREDQSIGSIAVIQVRDNISACDIKTMNTPLKIGDGIK